MGITATNEIDLTTVTPFLLEERNKTLSETEWRHRMRGFGFRLNRVETGVEVSRLPKGEVLGVLAM